MFFTAEADVYVHVIIANATLFDVKFAAQWSLFYDNWSRNKEIISFSAAELSYAFDPNCEDLVTLPVVVRNRRW